MCLGAFIFSNHWPGYLCLCFVIPEFLKPVRVTFVLNNAIPKNVILSTNFGESLRFHARGQEVLTYSIFQFSLDFNLLQRF